MAIPGARRSEGSGGGASALWPPPRDAWIAAAGVALLYGGHLFYGALRNDAALSMNLVAAALVGGALLSPRLRGDLLRLKGLAWPAGLFALTILVALWTLTPWTPGGPHPVWSYVGLGSGASTIDRSSTIMETIKLLGLACVFVLGAAAGARDDRARFALRLTLVAGVLFGLWALVGAITGTIVQTGNHRLEAHFLNANTAGLVFAVLLCLALGELIRRPRGGGRIDTVALLQGAAALTFAVCLVDTASRGAAAALIVALIVFLVLQVASGRLKLGRAVIAAGAAIVVLAVVVAVAGDLLVDRAVSQQDDYVSRLDTWRAHWAAFLDAPVFGYGLGSVPTINKTLLTAQNYRALWSIRGILNVYLQWLEQAGVAGAAPMFLCIGSVILATVRGLFRRSRMVGVLTALIAADVVVLVHGATDFGLEVFSVAAFWAWLLGLQFSLAQGSSQR